MAGSSGRPGVVVWIVNERLSSPGTETVEIPSRHSGGVVINDVRKRMRKSPGIRSWIVNLHCGSGHKTEIVTAKDIQLPIEYAGREFLSAQRHRSACLPRT